MPESLAFSRRIFEFALLLFVGIRSPAYQPVPQSELELKIPLEEEKDSYELYAVLLRTELPPEWKITKWTIQQQTQAFPRHFMSNGFFGTCLDPPQDQRATYLPLIENYVLKNQKSFTLEPKFDLPPYELVGRDAAVRSILFHVSAVAFNAGRSRALVYVGHHCGSLCGGGRYHLMVKHDGQWQADREYRGMTCMWGS